jgi:hypothetical protein
VTPAGKTVELPDLGPLTDAQLLQLWSLIMHELRERNVVRSANSPTGDYCELIVAAHFGVTPVANSVAGYDLVTSEGVRVQVKGRRFTTRSKPSHFSAIRNLEAREFDVLVALLLNEDFTVREAWSVTWEAVKRHAKFAPHVNAWRFPVIRGKLLDDPGITRLELQFAP